MGEGRNGRGVGSRRPGTASQRAAENDVRAAKQAIASRYLIGVPAQAASARYMGSAPGAADSGSPVLRSMQNVPVPDPTDNVVGVGIGDKVVQARLSGELCVKIYVRKKYPGIEVPARNRIPDALDGIPTDVEEVGPIYAAQQSCSLNRRHSLQPAPCGVSVGHIRVTAGTIGVLLCDRSRPDTGRRYILSNNHVLANSNDAATGDSMYSARSY